MSGIFDRLAAHPKGGGVLQAASTWLAAQSQGGVHELHGMLAELESMAQRLPADAFDDTLHALAAADERSRAMWGLIHAMWGLRQSEDLARAYGLKVEFTGDVRAVIEGRAHPASLRPVVGLSASGRAVLAQVRNEGGAA